jgi:hypothetical protein
MHMRGISAAAPRAFAIELGKHNITVNAVMPDMTPSETQVATRQTAAPPRARPAALGRDQDPEAPVGTVMFLSVAGKRLRHRPDHQCRRQQGDALTAHGPSNGCDVPAQLFQTRSLTVPAKQKKPRKIRWIARKFPSLSTASTAIHKGRRGFGAGTKPKHICRIDAA